MSPTTLAAPPTTARPRPRARLRTGWPLGLALAGYPLWWAVGATDLLLPVTAFLLLFQMPKRVRLPVGWGLWLLFLVCVVASATALDLAAPGTVPPSGGGRYVAYAVRLVSYVAVFVVAVFLVSTDEEQLSRRRVQGWLVALAVQVAALGWLALLLPGFSFPTLLGGLVPGAPSTASLAQVQDVIGTPAPRPAAPFAYTNAWGASLLLLLVWLTATWVVGARGLRRTAGVLVVVAAVVPLVLSLNRGVWIGAGLVVLYVAVRTALRGRLLLVGVVALAAVFGGGAVAASPLGEVVSARAQSGHSDDIRTTLAEDAVRLATTSPVLGYGTTRDTLGSGRSIAIGQSPDCPRCGNRVIGSTGQLWLVLVSQGLLGAGLYLAFLVRSAWAFRNDWSATSVAASASVLLCLYYSAFYTALVLPLLVTFIAIGLLHRQRAVQCSEAAAPVGAAR
ncbi:O-antigen ligase family protein [Pseudokineococcus marinus]|uniref:O-antigen ligase domain-containing protein n=1 Tax=Pseudokineococcus marinus TaxID=351215 RepID=A0A849BF41_9ACTN|nr:O-antigen ligase family protein [Pseudokineococcus marinus]NNH21680.1 O-antigen ligase domain-containing protein [Pseudokineococcus marinus]